MDKVNVSYVREPMIRDTYRMRITSFNEGVRHETARFVWRTGDGRIIVGSDEKDVRSGLFEVESHKAARNILRDAHARAYHNERPVFFSYSQG